MSEPKPFQRVPRPAKIVLPLTAGLALSLSLTGCPGLSNYIPAIGASTAPKTNVAVEKQRITVAPATALAPVVLTQPALQLAAGLQQAAG